MEKKNVSMLVLIICIVATALVSAGITKMYFSKQMEDAIDEGRIEGQEKSQGKLLDQKEGVLYTLRVVGEERSFPNNKDVNFHAPRYYKLKGDCVKGVPGEIVGIFKGGCRLIEEK